MRRYALISLLIGAGATVLAAILHFLGVFTGLDSWLAAIFTSKGIFPAGIEGLRYSWAEVLLAAAFAFFVAWYVVELDAPESKVVFTICSVVSLIGFVLVSALHGILLSPFAALIGLIMAAVGGFVFAGTERGGRKRFLAEALGSRVSRATFDRLLDQPSPPEFSGTDREGTILVCRLFDHESLREKMQPADLVKLSNLFVRAVSSFLVARGAYVEKAGQDWVVGSFGLLESDADHSAAAVDAALELRSRLRNLSQESESRWFQPLRSGVGIASGAMTTGLFGAGRGRQFGSVGPVTEYAKRLALANFRYGSEILIGPDSFRLLSGKAEVRPMEMFYDPERDVLTEIYEVIAATGALSESEMAKRDLFWQGVIFFREGKFDEALESLSRARRSGESDRPLEFLLERVQEGLGGGGKDGAPGGSGQKSSSPGHSRLIHFL